MLQILRFELVLNGPDRMPCGHKDYHTYHVIVDGVPAQLCKRCVLKRFASADEEICYCIKIALNAMQCDGKRHEILTRQLQRFLRDGGDLELKTAVNTYERYGTIAQNRIRMQMGSYH